MDALGKITVEEAGADNYHVFTKLSDDAVLVLIKSPNLKNFKMPARVTLLHAIESILATQPQTKGKQAYVGVKGRIAFGASESRPARSRPARCYPNRRFTTSTARSLNPSNSPFELFGLGQMPTSLQA